MSRKVMKVTMWTSAAALLLGAAGLLAQPPRESEADRRLREKIEARLLGQVDLKAKDLRVEVKNGLARVTGTVGSLGDVGRIERLVLGFVGVTGIANDVILAPSTRSDMAIRQEVREELDRYTSLRSPAVEVTVKEGQVTLTGAVEEGVARIDAGRVASLVPGVVRVNNAIALLRVDPVEEESVAVRVYSLLINPITFGSVVDLEVSEEDGVVVLEGRVWREADRLEAERLALTVPGVERVINRIRPLEE